MLTDDVPAKDRARLKQVLVWAKDSFERSPFKEEHPDFHFRHYIYTYYLDLSESIQKMIEDPNCTKKVSSLVETDALKLLTKVARSLYKISGSSILSLPNPSLSRAYDKGEKFLKDLEEACKKHQKDTFDETLDATISALKEQTYDEVELKIFRSYALGLKTGAFESVFPGKDRKFKTPQNAERNKRYALEDKSTIYSSIAACLALVSLYQSTAIGTTIGLVVALGGVSIAKGDLGLGLNGLTALSVLASAANLYYSQSYVKPLVVICAAVLGAALNYQSMQIDKELATGLNN